MRMCMRMYCMSEEPDRLRPDLVSQCQIKHEGRLPAMQPPLSLLREGQPSNLECFHIIIRTERIPRIRQKIAQPFI